MPGIESEALSFYDYAAITLWLKNNIMSRRENGLLEEIQMEWLLSYLRKFMGGFRCRETEKSGARNECTLYTREKGPICYEFALFPWYTPGEQFLQQLFCSSLRWYWESSRRYDPDPEYAQLGLPATRGLTPLMEASADEFMRDLKERDLNGDMRFIALYGLDPTASPSTSITVWLHEVIGEFLRNEQGPLWLVAIQIGDCDYEQIFVTHAPPAPVQELLRAWGVVDKPPHRVRPYRALGVAKLEAYRLPSHYS